MICLILKCCTWWSEVYEFDKQYLIIDTFMLCPLSLWNLPFAPAGQLLKLPFNQQLFCLLSSEYFRYLCRHTPDLILDLIGCAIWLIYLTCLICTRELYVYTERWLWMITNLYTGLPEALLHFLCSWKRKQDGLNWLYMSSHELETHYGTFWSIAISFQILKTLRYYFLFFNFFTFLLGRIQWYNFFWCLVCGNFIPWSLLDVSLGHLEGASRLISFIFLHLFWFCRWHSFLSAWEELCIFWSMNQIRWLPFYEDFWNVFLRVGLTIRDYHPVHPILIYRLWVKLRQRQNTVNQ